MGRTTLSLITIPLFTGAIGYVTNLSGVWMLFYPVRFAGVRVPGLAPLANVRPRRIQQIPGLGQLDPEAIAEQILATARGEIHDVVERIMERERPRLWHDLPPPVRASVHARVEGTAAADRDHDHR